MSSKSHFFRSGLNPLNLDPVFYIRSWEGVTLNNSQQVTNVQDLSGNGYDFTSVNNPTIVENGIGGEKSILLNGSYLQNNDIYTQITDLNIMFYWIVFKLEGFPSQGYQNILIQGAIDYNTAGSNFSQLNNINTNTTFGYNFFNPNIDVNVADTTLTPKFAILNKSQNNVNYNINNIIPQPTTGIQTINNTNNFIGSWRNNNANMLFSEYGVLNYNPTQQQQNDLIQYFNDKYNL